MQFPPNERVQIHFYLHKDTPPEYQKYWNEVLAMIDGYGPDRNEELNFWQSFMKLDSNKRLPILNRSEGGLGGDNNKTDKQIRFSEDNHSRFDEFDLLNISKFKPIVMDVRASYDGVKTWNLAEIRDLEDSFKEYLVEKWNSRAVRSMIVM